MYTITQSDILRARAYAVDRARQDGGFSWDSTIFAGVKSNSNQYTVGDFGEKLAEIVLVNSGIDPLAQLDHSSDLDIRGQGDQGYEVKTAFKAPEYYRRTGYMKPTKFFCNQIRFETVQDQTVAKPWDYLVFVLCNGSTVRVYRAQRSLDLRHSLGRNNDYAWVGTWDQLESPLWTLIGQYE